MMPLPIGVLINELTPDEWRRQNDFTPELNLAQIDMFSANSEDQVRSVLLDWIAHHQPCLFGRMAARVGALGTCIVRESELLNHSEEYIQNKIESARIKWLASTFRGQSSGFVLLFLSERIARSMPDAKMANLAKRFCSLYLQRAEVELDKVFFDEAYLAVSGRSDVTWRWLAGVNYFCANGDGRWWRDHRIPGGLAFSTNSVGHLVKSGILQQAEEEFLMHLGIDATGGKVPVDSLLKALQIAMQTIHLSSDGIGGKATRLLERGINTPSCPIELKSYLMNKEHRFYCGYYHTDHTLPSPYFEADVDRPRDINGFELDFTYLFDNSLSNPDHLTMGLGRRIRRSESIAKQEKVEEKLVEIASLPNLVQALKDFPE